MLKRFRRHWIVYVVLTLVSLGGCLLAQPILAIHPYQPLLTSSPEAAPGQLSSQGQDVDDLLQQGQQLYQSGQWSDAITVLQQAIATANQHGDSEAHLIALGNLALVYQQLQEWEQATAAVDKALSLIETVPALQQSSLHGSVLDVQGSVQLTQGQVTEALSIWGEAAQIYEASGKADKLLQNQVNQAHALQSIGFYRQAIALLAPVADPNHPQANSALRAIALQTLGDSLRSVGNLAQSQSVLESSLTIAQTLERPYLMQTAQLSLANTQYAAGDTEEALTTYQQLAQTSPFDDIQVYALSNQLNALVEADNTDEVTSLWPVIQSRLQQTSPDRSLILAYVNVAQRFIQLDSTINPSRREIAQFLAIALQQARVLGDLRSESYVLGTLGLLYETSDRLVDAKNLTEQALDLAQQANAPEISYQWQWQLGRIYKVEGDTPFGVALRHRTGNVQNVEKAIEAYTDAVDTLKQLRTNLVAVNALVQVTFQDSVEPIHRQLVSLLLDNKYGPVSPTKIDQAREVIESLQLAELDNFFREACLEGQPIEIDQVDQDAAVLYPIMLDDRLEVIVRLPNQPLRHYSSPVSKTEVESLVRSLRPRLTFPIGNRFRSGMIKLNEWLMDPIIDELKDSGVKTLVFVLDGALRNIPMAALYDGETYLLEHFSVAITPGLQLTQPRVLQNQNLRVLSGALSEGRQGFSPLPNIEYEIEQIQTKVPTEVLFNDGFTLTSFQNAMENNVRPIVHLATHGQFSSDKDETFLLTWDSRISIETLNQILQGSAFDQRQTVELLIMSACQTAAGDKQAALGLAGMAVRAGARSTIATLWRVDDEATALLMDQLYAELVKPGVSRAEALRQAQLKILRDPNFNHHPYFWAPFILVGSWL